MRACFTKRALIYFWKLTMERIIDKSRIALIQGDITEQSTDAIVNAANSGLMGGGGVDGAIHRAGGPDILEECIQIVSRQGRLPTGQAVITTGGKLKARRVIHTVGPVWHGGNSGEPELLASSYRQSLSVAVVNSLKSVSFPSISTGVFGYPVTLAAAVALKTVSDFLHQEESIEEVVFVLFDDATYQAYAQALEELLPDTG
jgi:O-acetyl-ADP-ribose deacetylase (regulator of RNase III)